ncbi:MAG: FAD binding domain-containing protein [Acidimicrobiia bacterium]
MKPAPFSYLRPRTLAEALEAVNSDPDALPLAGGQSLVALLAMRLARPSLVVDLNGLTELGSIRQRGDHLEVGALVRQREAERSELVRTAVPLLAMVLPFIGHREIRNRGTVGGSLVHADPAAELPAVAATLRAEMVIAGPSGTRILPGDRLVAGPFQSALEPGELLTAARFPVRRPGDGFAFEEVARRHGDFAVCGVAVHVRVAGERVELARVGLLGVGSVPVVLDVGEALLARPQEAGPEALERVGVELTSSLNPTGDMHGSGPYRLHLARVLVARCLRRAWEDAHSYAAAEAPGPTPSASQGWIAAGDGVVVGPAPEEAVVAMTVNGLPVRVSTAARVSLADVLRERLRLTGTHLGCEHGVCGACTVLVDGRAVRSCLLLAVQAQGAEITTVEALGTPQELHPLQEAFRRHHALQCGFCTPGFLMSAYELLRDDPASATAGRRVLAEELSGVLCRCTGYRGILEAVAEVGSALGDSLPGPTNLGAPLPPGARATSG